MMNKKLRFFLYLYNNKGPVSSFDFSSPRDNDNSIFIKIKNNKFFYIYRKNNKIYYCTPKGETSV